MKNMWSNLSLGFLSSAALLTVMLCPRHSLAQDAAPAGEPRETDEGTERAEAWQAASDRAVAQYGTTDFRDLIRRTVEIGTRDFKRERDAARGGRRPNAQSGGAWSPLGPSTAFIRNSEPGSGVEANGLVSGIALHPTDPKIIFVSTGSGGVWRTTDGGTSWRLLTENVGILQVGAVAVAPSNPLRVYAGTGCAETSTFVLGNVRNVGSIKVGVGVLISNDGGETWRVSRTSPQNYFWQIVVDRENADVLLSAGDNGVQRSTDGGETWTATLQTEAAPWCTRLSAVGPGGRIVYAGMYGPKISGTVWKSTDAGVTFANVTNNLPGDESTRSRIEVAAAPSDPNRVYALVSDGKSQIDMARSTDGGATWTALGLTDKSVDILSTQGDFCNVVSVDPRNPDVVYAGGLDTWKSTDAGTTFTKISAWQGLGQPQPYLHADEHVHVYSADGATLYIGNDGGLFKTSDGGVTFPNISRPMITFLVSSACQDPANPDRMVLGAQDNGSAIRTTGTEWRETFTGDGFGCQFSSTDPNLIFASAQNEAISRSTDAGLTWKRSINGLTDARGPQGLFGTLILRHPTSATTLFTATRTKVWRTDDNGDNWSFVSTGMPEISQISNLTVSPVNGDRLLLVDSARRVVESVDGGVSWRELEREPGSSPTAIRADRTDSKKIYVATGNPNRNVERLYLSSDSGASWIAISRSGQEGGLPDLPIRTFEQDPREANVLWAGTFIGLYRSGDGGATWQRFGTGLPNVPVSTILFTADGSRIRVGTLGRGIWEVSTAASAAPPTGGPLTGVSPVAAFTYAPAAPRPGHAVSFQDTTTGTPTSWKWEFGDGLASVEESPAHVYASPGSYPVKLTATNANGSTSATKTLTVAIATTGTSDALTYLVPVVLTSAGAGGAAFTTELTLSNRSGKTLNLTFKVKGTFEASSTYSLPAGQKVFPDVFVFLKTQTGMNVPDGNVVTSLRIEVRGADSIGQFGAQARVTTPPNADQRAQGIAGRFGLAFGAVPLTNGARKEAVVYGLQQTSAVGTAGTRSNLACVNAGGGSGGSITVEATYWDGATGKASTSKDTFTLSAFQFEQKGQPLVARSIRSGYATLKKTAGDDQFVCYGVLNDNVNGDGSFVPMVITDAPSTATSAVIPVIVGTSTFRSELTLANRTRAGLTAYFGVIPSGTTTGDPIFGLVSLDAGKQLVIPDFLAYLQSQGVAVPQVASAIFEFEESPSVSDAPSDGSEAFISTDLAYVGVRTYASNAGGLFGLAYPYSPIGTAADTEAYVYGLQQTGTRGVDGGTRSNLAIVHALGGSEHDLQLEVTYFGPDGVELGKQACTPSPCTLQAGEWMQFDSPLAAYNAPNGYARIRRVSGNDQFIAYGVLNDQANNDGSFVPMVVP